MKVCSWNILFRNKQLDAAKRFIAGLTVDVLCLQEVPEHLLSELTGMPYYSAYAPDVSRIRGTSQEHDFLVILSKHPIIAHDSFSVSIPHTPLRTRLFIQCMRPFGWSRCYNHGGMWADIALLPSAVCRIINVHLTLAFPRVRAEEFARAMRERSAEAPTIVCGDFNILESARISVLNWLLGGQVRDVFLWKRERKAMEACFRRNGFKNPLRGIRTHALAASQLDHILVPRSATVLDARAIPDPLGSDHRPVCVDLILPHPSL